MRAAAAGAAVAAATFATSAGAAQIFYQPIVTLSTAYNTNVNLDTTGVQSAEGYFADASTIIGIATPRSETTLAPRLVYNYYPTVQDRNRLEAFLNGNTHVAWERDRFDLVGFFDHRDDVNAEQPTATENVVNPGVGNATATTGPTAIGITRNYLILDPTFTHTLTQLSSIGFAGEYQGMRYSPDDTSTHINFNYYRGRLFYGKVIDQRTDLSIGVIGDRYQSQSIQSHSTSVGLEAGGGYNWTQEIRSTLTVGYQRTTFDETNPKQLEGTTHPWSATFSTVYTTQTGGYRFSIGRTILPSSGGGLYNSNQVQAQYDRDYTQRLHLTTAVRAFRDSTTTGESNSAFRNYLTASVRLQYMMSQTLFVAGSYTYVYQKFQTSIDSADNNVVALTFGYRGLQRQR